MTDYRGMYNRLFNKITDAIHMLQAAQTETEEMYIKQKDPDIVLLNNPDEDYIE